MEFRKPLYLNINKINQIEQAVRDKNIDWYYADGSTYWCATISPYGEIFLPTKQTPGHPQMAEKIIYPKDSVLCMLLRYFYSKRLDKVGRIDKSFFMLLCGYINIDGMELEGKKMIQCKYNPLAIDEYSVIIAKDLKDDCEVVSFLDEEHSSKKLIEKAKKVAFFKNKIVNLLIARNLGINQTDELLKQLNQSEWQFLYRINEIYERMQMSEDPNQTK